MHLVNLCCDLAARHGPRTLGIRVAPAAQTITVLSLLFAFVLPSTQGGPRSLPDRTSDDTLSTIGEKPDDGPRAAPTSDVPADPTPTSGFTQSIDLDLRTDPRKDSQVDGLVEWEQGKLTLGPGGSIHRALDVGAQANLTLRLAFTPLSEDGQTSTTDLAFQVRDRGDFVARLVRRREGGRISAQLQLIDRDTPFDGARVTRMLRKYEWKEDFHDSRWSFRNHYGLITVYCGDRRIGIAYADKEPLPDRRGTDQFTATGQPFTDQAFFDLFGISEPLEVSGWSMKQEGTPVACLEAAGTASVSYRKEPTWDRDVFDRAKRGLGLYPQSSMREWISIPIVPEIVIDDFKVRENMDSKLSRIKSLLGQKHPYYALALQGIATQLRFARKDAEAERLLTEAIEISERSLGPWHPDHVTAIICLARVYREAGKYDRAEAPLLQARKSSQDVFGAHSIPHALTLRELAMLRRDAGRYAEAETLLREAAEACRDSLHDYAETLSALIDVESGIGEAERARAALRQVRETLEQEVPRRRNEQQQAGPLRFAQQKENYLLSVDLANVRTRDAWELFRAGRKDAARKQAIAAFLSIVGLTGQPQMLGRAPDFVPNSLLTMHPSYSRVMLALGELFLALGEWDRAGICISVTDMGPGHSHLERGVLYRTISKLLEAYPQMRLTLLNSERYRLSAVIEFAPVGRMSDADRQELIGLSQFAKELSKERKDRLLQLSREADSQAKKHQIAEFERLAKQAVDRANQEPRRGREMDNADNGAAFDQLAVTWRQNILDWRLCALREFERHAGPIHADTIDAVRGVAQWQWRFTGPGKAEAPLRDAWARTLQLSDRVLPGLPEVQTYGFLENSRLTAELLLSCFRATTEDGSRDAYEVVWSSKGLATRLLMQRQQLLRAAKGNPEVGNLADELQTTRQLLARLSLSVPPDAAVQAHGRRLADLASRKEDLERELARLSETFRRARDGDRAGVADLVRRLPPKTAVVDLVERWQWTPPVKEIATRQGGESGPKPSELWGRKRCYDAFVVRPAEGKPGWSVAWSTLGDADELDRLLNDGIATLRQAAREDTRLAEQLRRTLWEPIEASLTDCTRVILIPDGRLAQIPWAALPGKGRGSYLIEDYALVQAPYGQYVARLLMDPALEGNGFLVVGGIDYGPEGKWSYLKGTAAEVEQLARLRPNSDTVRLSGESATKVRLRELLPGRRYVHLATHGEFLDPGLGRDGGRFPVTESTLGGESFDVTVRNPLLLSMLVLAGANRPARIDERGLPVGSDSFLTAEEVMGLDLTRTELVVLSACETGAGKVRSGEGVFSLERAFHIGGTRAVVASLWAVDDRATQALMGRFYQNLWANPAKPLGKLEALREAQLWLLHEGAQELGRMRGGLERLNPEPRGPLPPSYWAAFVLSGDWR